MAKTVTFDVLAIAKAVGFDDVSKKIDELGKTGSKIGWIPTTIAAVGAAAVPAAAGVAALSVGISGLGAAGLLAFTGLRAQWKAGTLQATDLGKQITFMKGEFVGLQSTAATAVGPGLTSGLKSLNPLFSSIGFGVERLSKQLGEVLSHLLPGLATLFVKLNPLFLSFGGLAVRAAEAFQRWAQSDGSTKLIAYMTASLPKVVDLLKNLAIAAVNFTKGLAPLGGLQLSGLALLVKLTASLPVGVWQALAPAIAATVLAMRGLTTAQKALNLVMDANPILLVAAAVTGLSLAFIHLMNTSKTFRKTMEDGFLDVASVAIHAMQSINHGFISPFLTGLADVFRALGYLPGTLGHNFRAAANAVAGFRDDVTKQLDSAQQKLSSLKASVAIANAVNNVAKLKAQIDAVKNKSISITTYLQQVILPTLGTPSVTHDSRGPGAGVTFPYDPTHRFSGGVVLAGHLYTVNELGQEVFASPGSFAPISGGQQLFRPTVTGQIINVATLQALRQRVGQVAAATLNALPGVMQTALSALEKVLPSGFSPVTRLLTAENQALDRVAAQRTIIANKLKTANQALAAAQQAWNQEAQKIQSTVIGSFDITTAGQDPTGRTTVAGILTNLQSKVSNAGLFARDLRMLSGHLNKRLLQQLAEAGPDASLGALQALVSASPGQIRQINSLEDQLIGLGAQAGRATSNALYLRQIQADERLVKALESQQRSVDKLERQIQKVAARSLNIVINGGDARSIVRELERYFAGGGTLNSSGHIR